MTFATKGYEVVKNAVGKELLQNLCTQFQILRDNVYFANNHATDSIGLGNDPQVEKSFAWYGFYGFEALLIALKPAVEKVTGKVLHPTYSYARIYYKGAEMAKHKDRPSCQYSLTLTVDTDGNEPWGIWMTSLDGKASNVKLQAGDMCVYKGDELEHWRTKFKGTKQTQVFLHYVDANGPYAEFKFDKRPMLGLTKG
jgi:hypothetical protein